MTDYFIPKFNEHYSVDTLKNLIIKARKEVGRNDISEREYGFAELVLSTVFLVTDDEVIEAMALATSREVEMRKPYHEERWEQEKLIDVLRNF